MVLDGVRQPPLQTGLQGFGVFTEFGNHGNLPFLDDDKAASQPQADKNDDDHFHHLGRTLGELPGAAAISRPVIATAKGAAAALGLAAEQRTQAIVEIPPDFVQVGWAVALIKPARRFGAVIVATSPTRTNGRAACRERVWQYVSIAVVAVHVKKNTRQTTRQR